MLPIPHLGQRGYRPVSVISTVCLLFVSHPPSTSTTGVRQSGQQSTPPLRLSSEYLPTWLHSLHIHSTWIILKHPIRPQRPHIWHSWGQSSDTSITWPHLHSSTISLTPFWASIFRLTFIHTMRPENYRFSCIVIRADNLLFLV